MYYYDSTEMNLEAIYPWRCVICVTFDTMQSNSRPCNWSYQATDWFDISCDIHHI